MGLLNQIEIKKYVGLGNLETSLKIAKLFHQIKTKNALPSIFWLCYLRYTFQALFISNG